MSKDKNELIKELEMIKAQVEWEYPLDYQMTLDSAISCVEKLDKIEQCKSDFKELERKIKMYFNMVDIFSEKTKLEKLALDITCTGIQTISSLNGILDE